MPVEAAGQAPSEGELEAVQGLVAALAGLVLLLAALDLLGWMLHLPLLTSVLPHYATMKPNTSASLALIAVACLLRRRERAAWVAAIAASLPLLLALATLVEYASGKSLGIDQMILHVAPDLTQEVAGRMSIGTGIGIALTSLALLVLDRLPRCSVALLLTGSAISVSALIGFVFDAGPLFGVPWLKSLAVHTAVCLLALQFAGLALRPRREPYCSLIASSRRHGKTRWLLAGVTIVPGLVALPLVAGVRLGLLDAPFAMALLVSVLLAVQTIILWQDSRTLTRIEARRRQAEAALLQNEKLAVVGRLAASISHEINNPLESVGNLLYLLQEAASLESVREYAAMAEQELARVSQITAQTLSFYRENRAPAPCDVEEILRSALKLLQTRVRNCDLQVETRFTAGDSPVQGKDGELRQIFINLISNAMDAAPEHGRLLLRTRILRKRATPALQVLIADDGSGMSPETLARLFEPFYTTKAETGNGLGLWVVQDLIEKHRGSIRVRSSRAPGRCGTTFRILLPLAAGS